MFPVGYLPYQVVVACEHVQIGVPCSSCLDIQFCSRRLPRLAFIFVIYVKGPWYLQGIQCPFVDTMTQKQIWSLFRKKMSSDDNNVKMCYTAEWTIITPGNLITGINNCIASQNYTLTVVINCAKYFLKFLYLSHFHLQYSEVILWVKLAYYSSWICSQVLGILSFV